MNNSWENTSNWTCGLLPDSTTDVVVNSGTIRINSNVVIRSLRTGPSVSITIASGYRLTVLQ